MSSLSKPLPTILLVPGAFTTPACYDSLAPYLRKSGYPVLRASLITTNPSESDLPTCSAEKEGLHLLNTYLLPLIEEQEKEVIVFAHSFGATCCSGGKHGLTRKERGRKGLKGGVLGVVYISNAFCKDGEDQVSSLGGIWPPFCARDTPSPGLLTFSPVVETLYNDLPPSQAEELAKGHLPQAQSVFEMPVREPLWEDGELDGGGRVYVLTKLDQTFPPHVQEMLVKGSGVEWDVKEVEAGHCGFIGAAGGVARVIMEVAGRWRE